MKSLLIFTLGSLFLLPPVQALETDNYLAWGVELKDSTKPINQYVNERISSVLEKANKKRRSYSCTKLTFKIGREFRTTPPFWHPLEDWIKKNLTDDYVYPKDSNYRNKSIYKNKFRFYLSFVKLAPSVQVGGVYLGTDKLSHFASTGRRYFKFYLKKRRQGQDHLTALKSAIRFGLRNESSYLGTWTSGVFSYGDMEANYQGLKFYQSVCLGSNPYIVKNSEGKWEQVREFDIKKYVNPYWDESFNISYRLSKNWEKTGPVIKTFYCPKYSAPQVQERFDYYRSFEFDKFSVNYIGELQLLGDSIAPNPRAEQSVEELCL